MPKMAVAVVRAIGREVNPRIGQEVEGIVPDRGMGKALKSRIMVNRNRKGKGSLVANNRAITTDRSHPAIMPKAFISF